MMIELLLQVITNRFIGKGPGSQDLAYGDPNQGFYGELPSTSFMTLAQLRSLTGMAVGVDDVTWNGQWLKLNIKGKTLFIPFTQVATDISYDALKALDLVEGKEISHEGYRYKVRLASISAGPTVSPGQNFTNLTATVDSMTSEWGMVVGGLINPPMGSPGHHWALYPTATTLSPSGKWVHAQQMRTGRANESIAMNNNQFSFSNTTTAGSIGWFPVLEVL